jgi:hypothetical protein
MSRTKHSVPQPNLLEYALFNPCFVCRIFFRYKLKQTNFPYTFHVCIYLLSLCTEIWKNFFFFFLGVQIQQIGLCHCLKKIPI